MKGRDLRTEIQAAIVERGSFHLPKTGLDVSTCRASWPSRQAYKGPSTGAPLAHLAVELVGL